jgi:hypothetical protein
MVRMDDALHVSAIVSRLPTWLAMIAVLTAIALVTIRVAQRPPA